MVNDSGYRQLSSRRRVARRTDRLDGVDERVDGECMRGKLAGNAHCLQFLQAEVRVRQTLRLGQIGLTELTSERPPWPPIC